MRADETLVLRVDLTDEFPEGVPRWMLDLDADECRRMMALRRAGFTHMGFDPGEDELDSRVLH